MDKNPENETRVRNEPKLGEGGMKTRLLYRPFIPMDCVRCWGGIK